MKTGISYLRLLSCMVLFQVSICSFSQSRGLKTITEKELRYNLEFLGAREFRGRETPSPELEIATLYLGNWLKSTGIKPLMGDGTFYQNVPLTVTSVFQPDTKITLSKGSGEQVYYFGNGFSGSFSVSGSYSGNIVFAGAGIYDPENSWDDLSGLDLSGKVVVILDVQLPGTKYELGSTLTNRLNSRISEIRKRGASAVLTIVDPVRQGLMTEGFDIFDYIPTGRLGILYDSQRTNFGTGTGTNTGNADNRRPFPFERAEISHEVAAEILDTTINAITDMFEMINKGRQVPVKEVPEMHIRLDIEVDRHNSASRNVVALVEGTDPVLKNEYIVICGHHDGRGIDDGEIISGADDNGTGTVALMELAQALITERPKRSVILAWFTGEEQGMNGSQYFINNCPVPVEKISACLNLDMIGRNDPDSLFLVGSDLLSTGLDASINRANMKPEINFGFDYRYSDPSHPQRVYFRSDHYPFVRFGIPGVWFFSGFTADYHTSRDVTESVDYSKVLKTTKLVYLTAFDIGNMKELLKLDVNPMVKTRGIHNVIERSLFE
jgi:hypothetical protein